MIYLDEKNKEMYVGDRIATLMYYVSIAIYFLSSVFMNFLKNHFAVAVSIINYICQNNTWLSNLKMINVGCSRN